MIRHIVMWKLKNFENPEIKAFNEKKLKDELYHLKKEIVQIKALNVGFNLNPDNEYDMVLEMEFDNLNDLMTYQIHPAHLKVVEFLKTIRDLKAAVDFEI
ncbi:MAG: Dabb family protein [Bacteroidetes bacterium]|nr:Dabb family protein [Bacteroidota bacterium]